MVVDLTSGEVVTTSLPVSGADTDIDQQMAWTPRGQRLLAGADSRGVIIDDPVTGEQQDLKVGFAPIALAVRPPH